MKQTPKSNKDASTRPRGHEKAISLAPLRFEEAVADLLKVKLDRPEASGSSHLKKLKS